jgi:hypothetical protein
MDEKEFKAIRAKVRKGIEVSLTKDQAQYMLRRTEGIKWKLDMLVLTDYPSRMSHDVITKNIVDIEKEMRVYKQILGMLYYTSNGS